MASEMEKRVDRLEKELEDLKKDNKELRQKLVNQAGLLQKVDGVKR